MVERDNFFFGEKSSDMKKGVFGGLGFRNLPTTRSVDWWIGAAKCLKFFEEQSIN